MKLNPNDRALLEQAVAAAEEIAAFSTEALAISRANEKAQADIIRELRAELALREASEASLRAELVLGSRIRDLVGRVESIEGLVREKLSPKRPRPTNATPKPRARAGAKR